MSINSYEDYSNGYEDKDPLALTEDEVEKTSMFLPNSFLDRAFNEFTAFVGFDGAAVDLIHTTKQVYNIEGKSEDLKGNSASDMDTSDSVGMEGVAVKSPKKSSDVDISDPKLKKPFELGWIRELVYRGVTKNVPLSKRKSDVYYIKPGGKKIRSFNELAGHLSGGLTADNFTFSKQPIGVDDDKEVVREAKQSEKKDTTPTKRLKTRSLPARDHTPKVAIKPRKSVASKMRSQKRKVNSIQEEESGPEVIHKSKQVCTVDCPLAMGLIPTLQCSKCSNVYHTQCSGLESASRTQSFVCKPCLKPSNTTVTAKLVPVDAKIPTKPDDVGNLPSSSQNIVGAVTTWLPESSTIQVNNESPKGTDNNAVPTAEQSLVKIKNNTFILVPRFNHNLVKVAKDQTTNSDQDAQFIVSPEETAESNDGLVLVPYSTQGKGNNVQMLSNQVLGTAENGLKRSASPDSSVPEKRRKIDNIEKEWPYMMRIDVGYNFILQVFEYLKVSELLRVSRVSKMWNYVAQHSRLWRTVKMKNSRVYDWEGFGNSLKSHRTENLDLRKMLLPADNHADIENMWEKFGKAVSDMPHLIRIDLGKCTASAIAKTAVACPQLLSLVTMSLRAQFLDLKPLSLCKNLRELRLKSMVGMEVKNLAALKDLPHLTTLGLTTIKNLDGIEECLSTNLTSLELGDCCDLRESFASDFLPCLINLKRLRLEKGTQNCPIMSLMNTISQLPNLRQLELINFDIQCGFDNALAKCTNLKVLLIIPTYIKQSATTNHVVMGGISQLRESLTYFIWGLTLELLRVTDIFIDQVESQKGQLKPGQKKQGTGDSIPILKPMQGEETADGPNSAQVDILGIPKLRKVLATLLPDTKIKILKVPFSSTWRQTVSDSPYH